MDELPEVKEIGVRGEVVEVEFADGFRAQFDPYSHGFGYQIEGLRTFVLFDKEGKPVCEVNCRLYRCGPMPDEGRIKALRQGWTQQQAAAYWTASKKAVNRLYFPPDGDIGHCKQSDKKYWYAWKVIGEGWMYIDWLVKGEMDMVAK